MPEGVSEGGRRMWPGDGRVPKQPAPTGPGSVAEKEPGNEAQGFHDGGFNWHWRLIDLPWV